MRRIVSIILVSLLCGGFVLPAVGQACIWIWDIGLSVGQGGDTYALCGNVIDAVNLAWGNGNSPNGVPDQRVFIRLVSDQQRLTP